MIDYTTYKRIYTAGDMFTLSGSDFIGYVAVDVNKGEARDADTGSILTSKNTYGTDLILSTNFKDRVASDLNLTLPKTLDECTFSINDNFNFELLKFKLDNLRANNTYTFSRLFIASNSLPYTNEITFAGLSSSSDTSFTIFNSNSFESSEFINTIPFSESTSLSSVGEIVEVTSQVDRADTDRFAVFAVTDSTFISMTGSSNNLQIIEQSTGYETDDGNELSFRELAGIASNSKYVFLSDKLNNVVIKYDIGGFTNENVAKSFGTDILLGHRRNYIELVGGFDGTSSETKFNLPTRLACSEKEVAVYDSGNKIIKIFDINFNFITRISSINLNIETFGAMEYDSDFGVLYVITYGIDELTNLNTAYLYRFNSGRQRVIEKVKLNDYLKRGEVVREISFSKTSSNYWYFTTQQSVYKKFKTRPAEVIGKFGPSRMFLLDFQIEDTTFNNRWNYQEVNWKNSNFIWNLLEPDNEDSGAAGIINNDIKGFNVFQGSNGNDKIILSSNSRFYFFNEPTVNAYQQVIKRNNYNNYGINGFSLSPEEFIQTSSINKEIHKLVEDILVLKNNIVGRFKGIYDDNVIVLGDYGYNLDFSTFIETDLENLQVHSNEEALVDVINRCFKEIYTAQLNILNIITVDISPKLQNQYNQNSIIQI